MQGVAYNYENPNNDGSNDPAGFLAYLSGVVPVAPASIAVTGHTSTTVSVNVAASMFMGAITYLVDGAAVTGQNYTLAREDGEATPQHAGGACQPNLIAHTLTGLTLATGTHTVQAFAVNRNGTQQSATGPSTTFVV